MNRQAVPAVLSGLTADLDAGVEGSTAWAVVELLGSSLANARAAANGSRSAAQDVHSQLEFASVLLERLTTRAEVLSRVVRSGVLYAEQRA
jgi:hypothetical protein